MVLHSSRSKAMSLNLSSDAKPRLKWTLELHQRFIDAVNQLGGEEKATPKPLMRIMGVHGLTLYHLKSHLQKYRLGRTHPSKPFHQNKKEEFISDKEENKRSCLTSKKCDGAHQQNNESSQIAQALQLQMEVQRKLHEQIEVQRRLQLRIEAQGKYLQSVLKKAQETISGYSSCSMEVERAKAELSQLMSMADTGCPSSSFSVLTESEGSMLKEVKNKILGHNGCSPESSLTSSESSGSMKGDITPKGKTDFVNLPLMEMRFNEKGEAESHAMRRKRNRTDGDEQKIDLNSDFDSGPKMIDLNCMGSEQ